MIQEAVVPPSQTISDVKSKDLKIKMDKRRTIFSSDKKVVKAEPLFGIIPLSWVDVARQNGIILTVVLGCYISSIFNIGIIGMVLVGIFMSNYFSISLDRTTRNIRAEIEKAYATELVNFQNGDGSWTNGEHAEWLNAFVEKYWSMFEPILSEILVGVVDPYLELYKPAFLDDLRFKEFSLGSSGVRIKSIEMNRDVEDDIIYMIMDVVYAPVEDNADANSNIILEIRLGKGMASTAIPVSVKDTYFQGKLHCRIKLMTKFPHVKVVEIWFQELPLIDFVLKPLGNLSLDVMNLPGIKNAILMIINMILNTILVAPMRMPIDVDTILNGVVDVGPTAILKIHLREGKNFKNTEIIGKSDPYCEFLLNGRLVASTDVFENNLNPHFDDLRFILINDVQLDKITFDVKDHDQVGFKTVGKSDFPLIEHVSQPNILDKTVNLYNNAKELRGQLVFDSFYFPASQLESNKKATSGILTVQIHQCKNILNTGVNSTCNAYAELKYNNDAVFKSRVKKRTNNPRFEESAHIFVPNIKNGKLLLQIKDQRDLAADGVVAEIEFNINYILTKKLKQDWYELVQGKVLLTYSFKPIYLSPTDLSSVIPASYICRLFVVKCRNLKNKELTGTSDPYCSVKCNSKLVDSTRTVSNSLNPDFNTVIYIPIRTVREKINFDIYDYNHMTKDKHMGGCSINISDFNIPSPSSPLGSSSPKPIPILSSDTALNMSDGGQLYTSAVLYPVVRSSNMSGGSSCFLSMTIHSFNVQENGTWSFQIHVDDRGAQYTSKSKKSSNPIFEESFDVFLKEIEFSYCFIRLYKNNDVVGEYGINSTLFSKFLNNKVELSITNNIQCVCTVSMTRTLFSCEDFEQSTNYGKLNINIIDAHLSDTYDPYCTLFINDKVATKSDVFKKTDSPFFNLQHDLICNRADLNARIEIRDNSRIGVHKLLSNIIIDKAVNGTVVYDSNKVQVKFTFQSMPMLRYTKLQYNEPRVLEVLAGPEIPETTENDTNGPSVDTSNNALNSSSKNPGETVGLDAIDNSASSDDMESGISAMPSSSTSRLKLTVVKSRNIPVVDTMVKIKSTYSKNGHPKKHLSSIYKSAINSTNVYGYVMEMVLVDPGYLRNGIKFRWILNGGLYTVSKLKKTKIGDFTIDVWQLILGKINGSKEIEIMEDTWLPCGDGEVMVTIECNLLKDYINQLETEQQNGNMNGNYTMIRKGGIIKRSLGSIGKLNK
eukprot:NODE_533_length_7074_cov_0.525878.p1 type:complete len:1224 gc:universal NODE_533_length_7074_cov_0.525878:6568-2897(-)